MAKEKRKILVLVEGAKTDVALMERLLATYQIDFKEKQAGGKVEKQSLAAAILEGLGGKDNIVDVTNCATRLRVNVKDEKLVQSDSYFKSIGTHGLKATKTNIQVIVGLKVPSVREDFEALL